MSNCLTQHISLPTHIKGNILDLLLCNTPGNQILLSHSVDAPLTSKCDHKLISFKVEIKSNSTPPLNRLRPNYAKADYKKINYELSKIDWVNILNSSLDFHHFYSSFINVLKDIIDKYVPFYKETPFKRPRYSKHIKKIRKEKLLLYKKSKTDSSIKQSYKLKCKEYELEVNKWHDNRELNLCKNPASKKFFKFVNQKLNSRSSIPPLIDDNQILLTSDQDKADLFNTQFQRFFVKDDSSIPSFLPKQVSVMPSFLITEQDITTAIHNMKDKLTRTPEEIPSYFLKRVFPAIILPLLIIFNTSLQTGIIPTSWKHAIVIPIFKKGSRNLAKNYRPISLTSSICRLFESIISKKILSHLLSNDLLSPQQFGFLPNRSSCSQLLSCLHKWLLAYSNRITTDIIYTDIRKAFDSVSHPKLISTLGQYKLNPIIINWIKNFLTGRSQQVALNDALSSPLDVYSGVPQGSIIGSLMFNIYFNDITTSLSSSRDSESIMLFADDAKVFSTIPEDLHESLKSVDVWLKSRQLQLACEKCFVLSLTKDQSIKNDYYLNNQKLASESIAKDLGIYISYDLKWEHHINHLSKISSSVSYQIRKSIRTKNIWTFIKLYTTYVRPKLEYNSPVWSPYLKKDILKLESVQRRFTKSACLRCSIPFTSYQDRITKLNLKTLEYRRVTFDLIFLFKIIHGLINLNFQDYFVNKNLPYSLRGSTFRIDAVTKFKSTQFQNCFFNRIPSTWNALPEEITSQTNLDTFKRKLNKFDLNTIVCFTVGS